MFDFLKISTRSTKRGVIEIYPKFIIKRSSDLMIRGGDFYAIWLDDIGLWSTDEQCVLRQIDQELTSYADENRHKFESNVHILYMWDAETGMIDRWHKYCQKQMRDNYHTLDEKLIFSNTPTSKTDYASKRLNYPLEPGEYPSYEKLMSVLYSPEERLKIEWAIGAIVTGDSKKLQKFMVLYGAAGTGKSTVLNIIQQLFEGYYSVFDAKALGSSNNQFALEAFRSNPLVAIQHDGDLSRIEDNTRLNSLVSHEVMTVNEKFKSTYSNQFKSFLFMGTNKPVKITDARSGLIRRLIDVQPSGNRLSGKEYKFAVKQISFELGAIACHCRDVYLDNPGLYDDYIPISMLGASNDFYNFVEDSFYTFKDADNVTLKSAWEMYKTYCDDAKVLYPYPLRIFKEELKSYFYDFLERSTKDGERVRNFYSGFRTDKFDSFPEKTTEATALYSIQLKNVKSIFDKTYSDCVAQYASSKETPSKKWELVRTTLSDLDTSRLHYVRVPENHIVIDFDIPEKSGGKNLEKNLEEASKWPPTYSELSKSGNGVHLHYIYTGDVTQLSRIYDEHIEVKVFAGKSSLRRKLTKCNELGISTITSGLPLKGAKKMVDFEAVKSEKGLRTLIKRNLQKEIHPGTKPSIDFIHKILEDAYSGDLTYDVSDMRSAILSFAASSTNQSEYCIKLVGKMRFKSEDASVAVLNEDKPIIFFDAEVFPNLLLVNWKYRGMDKKVVRMINPEPHMIEDLIKYRLIAYNCRRYDNHILYARLMGYTNEQLFNLSQKIISNKTNAYFGEAYNISYTDIYCFSSRKQSLAKWQIELGLPHIELGLPWDQPVPEDQWERVAQYCDNDVISAEAVFDHLEADFVGRQILADLAGMSVNTPTNTLTARIIFGTNRNPQDQFNYRNLAEPCKGKPHFPGYIFDRGRSVYRDEEVSEGGYIHAEPGIYGDVAVLDIVSMHPYSIILEELFGPTYTAIFKELVEGRVAIKNEKIEVAKKMLNGAMAKYLTGEYSYFQLAHALKIAINSVYGLTFAKFENPFRDKRNIDNIVAKRGALFMVDLKHAVQERGFIVAHIKTDSIKIPDATPEIIKFVRDFGKEYGYIFEHETTYDRMCLVNDAVFIAKHKHGKSAGTWDAVGTQFQVPYVFKTLFSKEEIVFSDLCETKAVTTRMFLDKNEDLPEDEHNYIFVGKVGSFCPVKEGTGGGILLREKEGKYYAVTGTKGYRWKEAETIRGLDKEDEIDLSYFDKKATDASLAISVHGDFTWFVSDDPYIGPTFIDGKPIYPDELPFA